MNNIARVLFILGVAGLATYTGNMGWLWLLPFIIILY